MNKYATRERDPQQPRHRAELPPTVPPPAELARMSDQELYPFVPKDRLTDGLGVETEVTNRLWCREQNVSRRHLQDLLEGRRKPKPGAKRHAKRGSTSPATPATGGTPAGRTEHGHPGGGR